MKMMFLAAALIFHFTVVRGAAKKSEPPAPVWRRLVAFVSMGLWVCVILAGLGIGFWSVND
jgi:hypothetical protein